MTAIPAEPFVLVDGSSYLYRAFHALPPLTNAKGKPTGAAYGVLNMLRKLQREYQPSHMAVVFDAKGKTFRDDLYPDYKANRPPMPDDLAQQIEPLHAMIQAMGLPLVVVEGVEADDVIGTLAKQAEAQGHFTLISTGDKDLAQLVNDNVFLINTMTGNLLDRDGVIKKFGLPPEQIIDYLTLVGDNVDNIPGVPKVGPKTALKWLNEYGSLQSVMDNAESIKGKIGENLRASLAHLPLSKALVTIACELSLAVTPDELVCTSGDKQTLIDYCKQMEFKTWLNELLNDSKPQAPARDQRHYETVLTEEALATWITRLSDAPYFAFDTETTSLDYMQAQLVGLSFSVTPEHAAYVPVAHDYPGAPPQLSREYVLQQLQPLLEDANHKKVGHNLKYDKSVLANHGVTLRGIEYDTMLESYILNSTHRNDLDSLALKYLGKNTIHFTDIAGKGAKQLTFNQIDLAQAAPYAAEDADITLQLHQCLWPKLQQNPGLQHVFQTIEMPLLPLLSRMERHGVLIDANLLEQHSKQLGERLSILEKQAHELAGRVFNLSSPKQLQEILFEEMKLPVLQKTPKGIPSTAESVLQELAHDYPLPETILAYRSLAKLKSTYTDKLPLLIHPKTGRVHTSYHQAGAATGRFSSTDPNLQNIPARTEEGRRIRQAFIAPPGHQLVAADYSQIELRIMSSLSQDEGLLQAFAQGKDIHQATAAEVFDVSLDEVTDLQRRQAKAINFGLIYGMSAFGLAKQLEISREEAQAYVDLYFSRYPGVKHYMEQTREKAHEQGYVETLFGRRLYLPEINTRNIQRQRAAERTAINAPMQGTAADIIKRAMNRVDVALKKAQCPATLIMQVHDELVFEIEESAVDACTPIIIEAMTAENRLSVPLTVSVGVGNNWDEAH